MEINPNTGKAYPQFILDLEKKGNRKPCKYCGKEHMDYACDLQIEFYQKQIKENDNI